MTQRVDGRLSGTKSELETRLFNKHATIDWDKIARERNERLADQAARGVDDTETLRYLGIDGKADSSHAPEAKSRPSRAKQGPSRRGKRPAKYDEDKAEELYLEGATVKQVAEEMRVAPETVRNMLKRRKSFDPKRDLTGGPKKKDVCVKGHSMEDAIVVKTKGKPDGRACRKCKAIRDREWNQKHKPWRKN